MKVEYDIPIEKGVRLTEEMVLSDLESYKDVASWFCRYPDIFLDYLTPRNESFKLYFYQRIFLRASLRYRYVFTIAPRAFSKSFISILAGYLKCVFLPNENFAIVAPGKAQGAKIAQQKIKEIWSHWPMLEKELIKANMGSDYVDLYFKNGSTFSVTGALDSTRGQRKTGAIIDELRDHDPQLITEVVLPLLNVSRRDPDGTIDPTEATQQQMYMDLLFF